MAAMNKYKHKTIFTPTISWPWADCDRTVSVTVNRCIEIQRIFFRTVSWSWADRERYYEQMRWNTKNIFSDSELTVSGPWALLWTVTLKYKEYFPRHWADREGCYEQMHLDAKQYLSRLSAYGKRTVSAPTAWLKLLALQLAIPAPQSGTVLTCSVTLQ